MNDAARARALSDEDLVRLLDLMTGADSVELKLTIPESEHRASMTALKLDPLDAHVRQVYFFDTPDLALDAVGVVVRARRIQNASGDTVIKLRPVVPDQIPDDVRRDAAFSIEVDAMPGGFVCSGSFKGTVENQHVQDAASSAGRAGPRRPCDAGAGQRAEAQVRTRAVRSQTRRRVVVLPRRLADPGAVHQVCAGPGVPIRRRGARLPQYHRHQPGLRSADEDQDRPGLLLPHPGGLTGVELSLRPGRLTPRRPTWRGGPRRRGWG